MVLREAFLIDQDGKVFPIGARLIIGRSREADLVINSGRVARRHVSLQQLPSGDVEADDLGSSNGTLVNGARLTVSRLLVPGDVLEVDGLRYTFQLGPEPARVIDSAGELIARAGDDEAALQVAIDLLLEQGDPAGALLASAERRPLSSPLEEAVALGTLELGWRRGFLHTARLRAQSFLPARDLLFELLRSDASRFLASLRLPTFLSRLGLEGAVLPLRVLRFGPFFTEADASRCAEAVGRARFLHAPHLGPPEFERYTKAWLEFEGGQRRELNLGRQETFPTCAVRWDVDGWLVAREPSQPTLLFNNRSRITALLAPGDTVTSGTTRFIFRAS